METTLQEQDYEPSKITEIFPDREKTVYFIKYDVKFYTLEDYENEELLNKVRKYFNFKDNVTKEKIVKELSFKPSFEYGECFEFFLSNGVSEEEACEFLYFISTRLEGIYCTELELYIYKAIKAKTICYDDFFRIYSLYKQSNEFLYLFTREELLASEYTSHLSVLLN